MAFNPINNVILSPLVPSPITRTLSIEHVLIIETMVAQPLKTTSHYCDSVQVQSVRSDMSDNVARIGLGPLIGWGNVIEPSGGAVTIDSPVNGVLDLATVFVFGTAGDEVSLLIME